MGMVVCVAAGPLSLRAAVMDSVLLALTSLTAAACLYRASSRPGARATWGLFGLSAAAAATAHVVWFSGGESELGSWLVLGSYVLFTTATAALLVVRERAAADQLTLDVLLVLGAGSVAVLRWAPALQGILADPTQLPFVVVASVVVSSIAAIASLLFALIRLAEVVSPSTVAIAGSAACFAIATLPLATRGVDCCESGNPLALLAASGWLFLAFAAFGRDPAALRKKLPVGWRLRNIIAPGVAVLMAVALVDAALRPPIRQPTAIALGLLGLVLAVRLTQLLNVASQQTREHKELAQARALIEVTNALAAETDLNATLAEVTLVACKLLNARAAGLELITEDGRTLEMKAAAGLPDGVIGMHFPIAQSFTGWVVLHGKPRETTNPAQDPYISEESRALLNGAALAAAPLRYRGQPLGALSCISDRPFSDDDIELLCALADQASIAIETARLFQQVHALSVTDPLTGLANRRQLERDLHREFAAARRGRQLIAVMFDLNGFKSYNDRHGHLAGDQALKAFADALAVETRAMNLAARYGGDEFVVLLADSDVFGAQIFIQRVRTEFATNIEALGRGALTAEAGIAEYRKEMKSPDELIEAADRELYDAKSARSST